MVQAVTSTRRGVRCNVNTTDPYAIMSERSFIALVICVAVVLSVAVATYNLSAALYDPERQHIQACGMMCNLKETPRYESGNCFCDKGPHE